MTTFKSSLNRMKAHKEPALKSELSRTNSLIRYDAEGFLINAGNLENSNILYVDIASGLDSTAIKGDIYQPYQTINAAIADAVKGDLVYIMPGVYPTGTVSLKDINFFLLPGAIVTEFYVAADTYIEGGSFTKMFCQTAGVKVELNNCFLAASSIELVENGDFSADGAIVTFSNVPVTIFPLGYYDFSQSSYGNNQGYTTSNFLAPNKNYRLSFNYTSTTAGNNVNFDIISDSLSNVGAITTVTGVKSNFLVTADFNSTSTGTKIIWGWNYISGTMRMDNLSVIEIGNADPVLVISSAVTLKATNCKFIQKYIEDCTGRAVEISVPNANLEFNKCEFVGGGIISTNNTGASNITIKDSIFNVDLENESVLRLTNADSSTYKFINCYSKADTFLTISNSSAAPKIVIYNSIMNCATAYSMHSESTLATYKIVNTWSNKDINPSSEVITNLISPNSFYVDSNIE
jgi:hypothetical protein